MSSHAWASLSLNEVLMSQHWSLSIWVNEQHIAVKLYVFIFFFHSIVVVFFMLQRPKILHSRFGDATKVGLTFDFTFCLMAEWNFSDESTSASILLNTAFNADAHNWMFFFAGPRLCGTHKKLIKKNKRISELLSYKANVSEHLYVSKCFLVKFV